MSSSARPAVATDTSYPALSTSSFSPEHQLPQSDHVWHDAPPKTWQQRALRKLSIAGAAAMVGMLTFAVLTDGGSRLNTPRAFYGDLERLAIAAGFGIKQVSLSGHRYTLEDDIFDALDLGNMQSFLSFDSAVLRERLERLSWIKMVEASRVYPGQLKIRVTEREPAAVWHRGGQAYLIDSGGRVLAAVESGVMGHLPRLSGEGAPRDVGQLFALLQQFPDVAGFVVASERVGERRWTLKLVGGGAVHLPAGQEASALQAFLSQDRALDLIQRGASIIDLRARGRIAVRAAAKGTRVSSRGQQVGGGV